MHDFIIIGSGFGGSAAALKLARSGKKVLVLERGRQAFRDEKDWDPKEMLVHNRYSSKSYLLVKQNNSKKYVKTHFKEITGGNSVFYGGASLRMRERDFDHWPISYNELEPYYTEAEHLIQVHGEEGDPYDPPRSGDYLYRPIELNEPSERIRKASEKLGHHPFKIPMAINFSNQNKPLCIRCNTCDGFPCKLGAKNDASLTLLQKAIEYGAELYEDVIVSKLNIQNKRIKSVICFRKENNEYFELKGYQFILAAGAIHSPSILFRSELPENENKKFVGHYLMRHCNAIISSAFPFKTNPQQVFCKQICLTDFYEDMRKELDTSVGCIQDIYMPSRKVVKKFSPHGLKNISAQISPYMQNLLCIAEDEPVWDNRVGLSQEIDIYGIPVTQIEHKYTHNDEKRLQYLIQKGKKILRKTGGLFNIVYYLNTFSHAIGTIRFGSEPKVSALDKNCKYFGLDNLYVLDGSFMPTSGGVNPSLTIIANSLRVANSL